MTIALTPRQSEILTALGTGAPDGHPWRLTLDIRGPVDEARLRRALDQTIATHEALRLEITGGVQRVRNPAPVTWETAARTSTDSPPVQAAFQRMGGDAGRLILTLSPLVFDRGSVAPLLRTVAAAYADRAEEPSQLDFTRYAAWREELAQAPDAADGHAYWRYQTGPEPRLPYRNVTTADGRDQHQVQRRLPDIGTLIPALAARGLALEAALQALWWVVAARITGQDSFQAWWRHDPRRDYDAFQGTVGPLEDWLPVAVTVPGDSALADVLAGAMALLEEHRAQQEYRSEIATNMPSLGFAVHEPIPAVALGGLVWTAVPLERPLGAVALALDLTLDGGRPVVATLRYDPALYGDGAMAALLDQYAVALAALLPHLDGAVRDLPLLSDRDRQAHAALDQRAAAIAAPGVIGLLLHWAARQPTAPALCEGDAVWSYAELLRQVDHLARHLRHAGVAAETRVALVMPRGAPLVLALWAVLRAGGAYVPVDPAWPEARRAATLAAAQPHRALTADDVAQLLAQPAPDVALAPPKDRDAAYVIFTSGSTGTPKGVVVEHAQLAAYAAGVTQALGLAGSRRFALTSTVAADLGNTTLFGAVATGGCLVVADDAAMADGAAFARFIADRDIDCLKIVPSHLAALLDTADPRLPRTLVLGGERAPAALLSVVRALDPDIQIFNHYGPTETTVGVMVHKLDGEAVFPDSLPLDRVLAGTVVRLLDAAGRPAPLGAVGEVHVGGAQVCRGYLNRTDDPAFIDDPLAPGQRLYRTGDLGRLGPDGALHLIGRADDQVKVRGYRVEPAEIEAAALAQDGVRQAAVRPWGEGADLRLVLYVVGTANAQALRAALAQRLPDAFVPAQVVTLPALPRLGNGKVDRDALPAPDAGMPTDAATAASDPLEDMVAGLVAGLLERGAVGRTDNLFDLGLHSLLVIKLVARLRRRLGVEMAPALVFDHPTVTALAGQLRTMGADPDAPRQAVA
ncbi:amino acid adenylation domain-containing protein [Nitrospirillum amazonense]|uniref:Amino acid adenylation domain-containing protein n=1 Tax=Nitrospirillum amazonense TaxID=28077 RepID=A0A560EN06_9PROT|nr:amino acid adenylation domain-containing protein [Nitrospirillum amazonense]TWB10730.1 amino acid adenylation domain-containing protein [Nitrospirillum amazonense]